MKLINLFVSVLLDFGLLWLRQFLFKLRSIITKRLHSLLGSFLVSLFLVGCDTTVSQLNTLTASISGVNAVLSWNDTSADYYEIYRSNEVDADSSTAQKLASPQASAGTSYQEKAIIGSSFYWVKSCYSFGCSSFSNRASVQVSIPQIATLSRSVNGVNSVLSWSDTSADYYEIYLSLGTDASSAQKFASPQASAGTSYQRTAVIGTRYYWIKSCNIFGCSGFSNMSEVTAFQAPLLTTSMDGSDVVLQWNSVSADYYEIYRSTGTNPSSAQKIASPQESAGVIYPTYQETAIIGTSYYWIKACNSNGCSVFSYVVEVIALQVPTLTASVNGVNAVLSWNDTSADYYEVYRSTGSDSSAAQKVASPQASSGTSYQEAASIGTRYWVKACNSLKCSGFSNRVSIQATVPQTATLTTSISGLNIVLNWNDTSADYYEIYRSTGTDSSTAEKVAIQEASAGTSYQKTTIIGSSFYWVKSCYSFGCSSFSNRVSIQAIDPQTVTLTASISGFNIVLSWNDTLADYYEIYRSTGTDSSTAQKLASPQSARASYQEIRIIGINYYYWVKSCNGFFCSAFSNMASALASVSGGDESSDQSSDHADGSQYVGSGGQHHGDVVLSGNSNSDNQFTEQSIRSDLIERGFDNTTDVHEMAVDALKASDFQAHGARKRLDYINIRNLLQQHYEDKRKSVIAVNSYNDFITVEQTIAAGVDAIYAVKEREAQETFDYFNGLACVWTGGRYTYHCNHPEPDLLEDARDILADVKKERADVAALYRARVEKLTEFEKVKTDFMIKSLEYMHGVQDRFIVETIKLEDRRMEGVDLIVDVYKDKANQDLITLRKAEEKFRHDGALSTIILNTFEKIPFIGQAASLVEVLSQLPEKIEYLTNEIHRIENAADKTDVLMEDFEQMFGVPLVDSMRKVGIYDDPNEVEHPTSWSPQDFSSIYEYQTTGEASSREDYIDTNDPNYERYVSNLNLMKSSFEDHNEQVKYEINHGDWMYDADSGMPFMLSDMQTDTISIFCASYDEIHCIREKDWTKIDFTKVKKQFCAVPTADGYCGELRNKFDLNNMIYRAGKTWIYDDELGIVYTVDNDTFDVECASYDGEYCLLGTDAIRAAIDRSPLLSSINYNKVVTAKCAADAYAPLWCRTLLSRDVSIKFMEATSFRHNKYIANKLWISPEYAGGRLIRDNAEGKVVCASTSPNTCILPASIADAPLSLIEGSLRNYDTRPATPFACDHDELNFVLSIPTLDEIESGSRSAACMAPLPEDIHVECDASPDYDSRCSDVSANPSNYVYFLQEPVGTSVKVVGGRLGYGTVDCSVNPVPCGFNFTKDKVPYYTDTTDFTNPNHMVSDNNFASHMDKAHYREKARNLFAHVVGSGNNLIKHFTLIGDSDGSEYDVTVDLGLSADDVSTDLSSLEHYSSDIDYMMQYFIDFLLHENSAAAGFTPIMIGDKYIGGRPAAFVFDDNVAYILLNKDQPLTQQTRFLHYVEELGSAMLWDLCRTHRLANVSNKQCMGRLGDEGARFSSVMTKYDLSADSLVAGSDSSSDEHLVYSLVAEPNFTESSPITLVFSDGNVAYMEGYKPINTHGDLTKGYSGDETGFSDGDHYGDNVLGGQNGQVIAIVKVGVDVPSEYRVVHEEFDAKLVYFAPRLRKHDHPTYLSPIEGNNVPTLWLRISLQDEINFDPERLTSAGSAANTFTTQAADAQLVIKRNHGIELPFQKVDGHWEFQKENMVYMKQNSFHLEITIKSDSQVQKYIKERRLARNAASQKNATKMFKYLNLKASTKVDLGFGVLFKFPYANRDQFYGAISIDATTNVAGAVGGAIIGGLSGQDPVTGAEIGSIVADLMGSGLEVGILGADITTYGELALSLPFDYTLAIGKPKPATPPETEHLHINERTEDTHFGDGLITTTGVDDDGNPTSTTQVYGNTGDSFVEDRPAATPPRKTWRQNMTTSFGSTAAFRNTTGMVNLMPLYIYTFASATKRVCGAFEAAGECRSTDTTDDTGGDISKIHD